MQARRGGARHLGERRVHEVRRPGELGHTEPAGLGPHPFELVAGNAAQHGVGRVARDRDDDEVAQALQDVLDEPARLVPRGDDLVDDPEDRAAVARGERVDDVVQQGGVGEAEQADREVVVHDSARGARDELVHHRERVAHRAAARAGDEREHSPAHLDALGAAEVLQVGRQHVRRHQPERIVVSARPDGADHLVRLRGREDELDVGRRLLDDLEQCVEPLRRHHVRLVEDEDLVAVAGRRERGALAQVACVVDTVVGGGVDLDHVERPGAAARQLDARGALAARGVDGRLGRVLRAVQRAREDPGRRRLAAAARAAEEIGVVHPTAAQGLHEGARDVVLADHLGERLGPVAAVEGGAHPRNDRRHHRH